MMIGILSLLTYLFVHYKRPAEYRRRPFLCLCSKSVPFDSRNPEYQEADGAGTGSPSVSRDSFLGGRV